MADAMADAMPDAMPRALETLLPLKSTWKYLDDGTDQMTAWKGPTFSDTAWKTGPAPLGYGDAGKMLTAALQTTVTFGADATMKFVTTYFRTTFTLTNVQTIKTAVLEMSVDDGAVVYINGVEVVPRINMPMAAFDSTTVAMGNRGDNAGISDTLDIMPITALKEGMNVIAVEVHQSVRTSSDLIMDLALKVERTAVATDAGATDAADMAAVITDAGDAAVDAAGSTTDTTTTTDATTDATDDAVDATTG